MEREQAIAVAVEKMAALGDKNTYGQQWFKNLSLEQQSAIKARDAQTARAGIDRILAAIDARDVAGLVERLHTGNPVSCWLFSAVTGFSLGKTNKTAVDGIRRFVGAEIYDAVMRSSRDRADADRARRETEAAQSEVDRVLDTIVGYKIGDVQKTGTRRQFIDDLIEAGYRPENAKRGFAVIVRMSNGNRYFNLTSKAEMKYAREQSAAISV